VSLPLIAILPNDLHTHRFDAQVNGRIQFVAAPRIVNFRGLVSARSVSFVVVDGAPNPNEGDVDLAMRAGASRAQLVQVWNHDLWDWTLEELVVAINSTPWRYGPQWQTAILEPGGAL
jgi:hypothetical protein